MFSIWESSREYLILKCCFLFYSCQIAISLARVCLWVIVCVFYASFQSLLKHLVLNFSYDTFNRSFNFLLLLLGCWLLLRQRQRQLTADCDVCEYGLKLLLKSNCCCCCCYYYFYYVSVSYWYCYFFLALFMALLLFCYLAYSVERAVRSWS